MIGFYDYTVILTYLSILSGTTGIILCLNGVGHPYLGMFFLLFSGLCDTFDGKVARSKKDRTEQMKKFGIQIDSLSDLIAFGVLPACIGIAMIRRGLEGTTLPNFRFVSVGRVTIVYQVISIIIAIFYVLVAMIRLAYFNVLEEENENRDESGHIYRTAGNKCSTGVSCGIADTYFCKSRFNAFIFWRYDRYGIFIYL